MSISLSNDSDKLYVIYEDTRFGARAYSMFLEYMYFPPFKPHLNEQYTISPVIWLERTWFVITVPIEFSKTAHRIAKDLGMLLVNGTPAGIFTKTKWEESFPFVNPGDNVFTLENRERPAFHAIPWMTESQLIETIILQAQQVWGHDCTRALQEERAEAESNHLKHLEGQKNMTYKLNMPKMPS
jgi:hypothetical protein